MTGAAWFDPERAPNNVPLGFQKRDSCHPPTYDQDEAYAAVAEALVKADDVHELVQDVAEAQLALEWAEANAPREFKNRLMLLRLQAKKLAKAESDWGKENAE